jgi:hypothetical protein
MIAVDADATKLRGEWIPKFEAVLGEKKAAIFQIDRRRSDAGDPTLLPTAIVQPLKRTGMRRS